MIAWLKGRVVDKEERAVILDVQGVGYRVVVLGALAQGVSVGEEMTVRIYHQISDDTEELYGFAEKSHLEFFHLLLTVPSVGPKTAMNILQLVPPETLKQAVAEGDMALLTKVSGVGKKTAQRILVELKEKIGKKGERSGATGKLQEEAMEAMVSIGYTRGDARRAVTSLPSDIGSVEEAVKFLLKQRA